MELEFPIEFVVPGTPPSLGASAASRTAWKERVKGESLHRLPEGHWASDGRIAVTLFYFPEGPMEGDVDNIVKTTLDALTRHIYIDDGQVERVLVQRFQPDLMFPFATPTRTLLDALDGEKPLLYIRVSNDPFEDLT